MHPAAYHPLVVPTDKSTRSNADAIADDEMGIACITYHKYTKEEWPESWFTETQVAMPGGEILSLKLAEMGSWIGDHRKGLWVREVRKLTQRQARFAALKGCSLQREDPLQFKKCPKPLGGLHCVG